ncbi:MAG: SEC-C domain-containing protein, partial [Candidatus Omnitrophica bacterium]|nr:SEC-C domain-containing protein [Candidatus Omnitrophota bacterium]
TITFQNYFRMYDKLSGMTGTAYTEANEFKAIYKLDVVVVPTNRQLIRSNYPDCIYKTEKEKFNAVVEEICGLYKAGRPVLVGTISIAKSEFLSEMLKLRGIPHQVLNAKYHEMEAQIVAQAGRYKAVTIATNMAGRGTDILLGGNAEFIAKSLLKEMSKSEDFDYLNEHQKIIEKYKKQTQEEHQEVVKVGGLHVLGTERHEARRIDNQLRGRSGRQGDPGSSRFYVSLDDDLMRLFGSDRLVGIMDKLGFEEGQVIEHPWITRSIEIAQRRIEQHNFEIRKQLLEYDNVMNKQREVVYGQRRQILEGFSLKDNILGIANKMIEDMLLNFKPEVSQLDKIEAGEFLDSLKLKFGLEEGFFETKDCSKDELKEALWQNISGLYDLKESRVDLELMRYLERMVFLQIIDSKWKDHLLSMDRMKEGIGLRAYGHRDPLIEYKKEAFDYFQKMVSGIEEEAVEAIFKLQPAKPGSYHGVFDSSHQEYLHPEVNTKDIAHESFSQSISENKTSSLPSSSQNSSHPKVGRNDPCPCGSGNKYKKCCGK